MHSEFCEPRVTVIQLPWHNISGAEQVSKKRYLNNKIQKSCEGGSGSKKLYSIMWILILFHVTLPVFRIRIHLSESSSIWIRIRFQIQWVTILTRTFSTGFPVIQMLPQTSKEQRTRKSWIQMFFLPPRSCSGSTSSFVSGFWKFPVLRIRADSDPKLIIRINLIMRIFITYVPM